MKPKKICHIFAALALFFLLAGGKVLSGQAEEPILDFDYTGMEFDEEGNVNWYSSFPDLTFPFNKDPGDVKVDWFVGTYHFEGENLCLDEAFPDTCYTISEDTKSLTLLNQALEEMLLYPTGEAYFVVNASTSGEGLAWMTIHFRLFDFDAADRHLDGNGSLLFPVEEEEYFLGFNGDPGDQEISWYVGTYHYEGQELTQDTPAPDNCYAVAENGKSITLYGSALADTYLTDATSASLLVQTTRTVNGEMRSDPWKTVLLYRASEDLPAVTLLGASPASPNGIEVTWEMAQTAEGYVVYRKTAETDWEEIGSTLAWETVFLDQSLDIGTEYTYTVAALRTDESEQKSGPFDPNGVSCLAVPGTVMGLTVTSDSENHPVLEWEETPGVTGYEIWASQGLGGTAEEIASVEEPRFVHTDADTESTYVYQVRSFCDLPSEEGKLFGEFSEPVSNGSASPQEFEKIHSTLKDSEFIDLSDTEALKPYLDEAVARKEAILLSPTKIVRSDAFLPGETYTGTAYYISPNGSNDNDGRSPETAWADTSKADWVVQPGDAVFFERGGTYRLSNGYLTLSENVTYSAYGEGPKPVITLSDENSARPECWELWHEGEQGERIWKYYRQVGDVGGIVFDDSAYAKRILEWPTPNGWLALNEIALDPVNGVYGPADPSQTVTYASAGEYREVNDQLTEDLTYLSRVGIDSLTYPVDFCNDYGTKCFPGDLYLRCDAGNPGECFTDIEIMAVHGPTDSFPEPYGNLFDGNHADGFVLDNLSFKYYLDTAVCSVLENGKNAVIQNCAIEWGGNRLHNIESEEPTTDYALIGDSIYNVANNATIRNNYIRQSANGCTFENAPMPYRLGTYLAEGNLIENCGQGIRTFLIAAESENIFDEVILRDNIILYTGESSNNADLEAPAAIDLGNSWLPFAKQIEISGNVLLGSTLTLFRFPDSDQWNINIHDNVVAQESDQPLIAQFYSDESGWGFHWYLMRNAR